MVTDIEIDWEIYQDIVYEDERGNKKYRTIYRKGREVISAKKKTFHNSRTKNN